MANGPVWGLCLLGLKGEPAPIDIDIDIDIDIGTGTGKYRVYPYL